MSDNNPNSNNNPKLPKFNNAYLMYAFILLIFVGLFLIRTSSNSNEINQKLFDKYVTEGKVAKVDIVNKQIVDVYLTQEALKEPLFQSLSKNKLNIPNPGPHLYFEISSVDYFLTNLDKLQANLAPEKKIEVTTSKKGELWNFFLTFILPILLIVVFWMVIMRRMGSGGAGGVGGGIFNIGKSRAQVYDNNSNKVNITFKDVAGLDEAKEEVMEVVDFLKTPKKYTALGGKIPKGVLLVGPPGTGKTLLAKAVAGEAKVPFFSMSGSDFVEMFVGVGASRVRDLFKQAREKAPCIIFIDEIDAVGRARGKGMMGSNDERESTLNQLLVEMDGFGTDSGVIIVAATNRPDVLDSALLRPGRFDRQISIDKPDIVGREQIFAVHLKPLTIKTDGVDAVNANLLAQQTPGFAGAEIANVCNEAALIAARKNKTAIDINDFNAAIDRVIGGLEKKNKIISPEEKTVIAYHEAGHALIGWYLEHTDPLVKVTIVPRGIAALGFAQYLPKENYIVTTDQMEDRMCMALGGRAAEQVVFNRISTGAQSDLDMVTRMSYAMVTVYGMNTKIGNVSFYGMGDEYGMSKPYSDETAKIIDEECRNIIDIQYLKAIALITEKRDKLEAIAQELLSKEILYQNDLERLIGKSPFDHKYHYHTSGAITPDLEPAPDATPEEPTAI